ncbi:peptidyl-prolyl cis-trans isomerase SurA [Sphingobium sp. B2D3B]|nr:MULTISPECIES: peptidylprolyl isomerase [unclassified Sphingobium]MCW2369333.1 peptidyl-prolyl cis-trans isomerase SurA [Sphingobium sp. B11D3D]MCW2381963.1 peptidyl-prolyl cis-trans isomerase SurA [Sphingobium sp. B2D3B]MCW2397857.1 peptidyl-prolyl cis-trans isomerase SurA [Sphingobium sp. B2D3C]MCW2411982.1 peptidyl-prolyl cis-trans isomerase SurA [Sphingobium sp. B8D3D]MCW2415720.1 peptidyl-prolyl cis-trans isomerase SurA [Sphingobium sp. B8D3A]
MTDVNSVKRISSRFTARILAGAATGLLACSAIAQAPEGQAEDAAGATASALDIPASVVLFGKRDPNVRTATALVNGEVITQTDVEQRLALVVLANGGNVSAEEKDRLRLQVLRNLIDETLQIQEAAAKDIRVPAAELDENFARVAANFRYTPDNFAKYLAAQGSSARSIRRQIEGEVAWSRLLRRQVQPFVNVSEDEVRSTYERLQAAKGKEEFHIGEIYLSANPSNSQQVAENAQKIMAQIRQGGSFQAYARQYSEASTAAVGGDLGWVRAAQLPEPLAEAAQQLQVGQIAGPIAIPGGFSLVYLIDKRQVLMADARDAVLSLKQVAIDFPAGTSAAEAQRRANAFGEALKKLQGCGSVEAMAKGVGATVIENDIQARNLPPQLQSILLSMQVGESTPPFGSATEGVRALVLCGRDDPPDASAPSVESIMAQMEEDRVNKRARTYLRDLRRDAVIDYN